jgi:hypothetical protein
MQNDSGAPGRDRIADLRFRKPAENRTAVEGYRSDSPNAGLIEKAMSEQDIGRCATAPRASCAAMAAALGQSDEKARTGIVMGIFPPFVVGIRCKGAARGSYRTLILRLCPWCGEELPQGAK